MKTTKVGNAIVAWRRSRLGLLVLLSIAMAGIAEAQKRISQEYQVKALFLFNFTQFVEWPPEAFVSSDAPLVIGVLGEDPFGQYLDDLLKGEKAGGHPLVVRRFSSVEGSLGAHVLFINLRSKEERKEALKALDDKNVLSVSDAADFTRQGGMIQFFIKENKIRLRVGLVPTTDANLSISSKLLRLAEIDDAQN